MFDLPQPTATHPCLLITDFDGTVTERDFYRCALEHLPQQAHEIWTRYEADEISLFEALHGIFAQLPAEETQAMAIARETGLDANVRPAVERLWAGGWQTIVVSAGSAWYSRRLLAELGLQLPVIANPGEIVPGQGLQMRRLPHDSPFYSEAIGVDKAAVVRAALQRFDAVAFAGDSLPDRSAAELVSSDLRFARGWLADRFDNDHVAYRRFERWPEIPQMLLRSPEDPPLGKERPR